MNITWIGSPNFDTKRKIIDRIIIHWFGSKGSNLKSTDNHFQNLKGTSAHYGIEDDQIHQYVKDEHVAYSAGVYAMNQRSISIEHSANVERNASDKTYETSGELLATLSKKYNIPLDRTHILKHSEVKATQCCGTVDVERLITIAKKYINNSPIPPMNQRSEEDAKYIDQLEKAVNEKDSLISKQSQDLLDVGNERDRLVEQLKLVANERDDKEKLRAKWYEAYQQANKNFDTCKTDRTSFQKRVTELEKTSYLTSDSKVLAMELLKRILHIT